MLKKPKAVICSITLPSAISLPWSSLDLASGSVGSLAETMTAPMGCKSRAEMSKQSKIGVSHRASEIGSSYPQMTTV